MKSLHQVSLPMKLSQTSLSSPSILFHAVAPSRKQGRPSVRVSQIVDGSKPTIQPRLKKHAAGRPPEESLDLPCGSSLFSPTRDAHHPGFFAKNSLSTLSGLWAAQRNQGRQSIRQSDVDFVAIPISSNKFGLLQNDAEVDDLLAENDKVKESRGRQRSTTARESGRGRINGFLYSLSWGQAFHKERCYRQHRFLPLKIQYPQLPPLISASFGTEPAS